MNGVMNSLFIPSREILSCIVAIAWGDGINSFEEVIVYDEDANMLK